MDDYLDSNMSTVVYISLLCEVVVRQEISPETFTVQHSFTCHVRPSLPLRGCNMEASLNIAIISASNAFLSAPIAFLVANTCICTLHASHLDKPTILTGVAPERKSPKVVYSRTLA